MSLDFVVWAPVPYRHQSAGFRALYKLADELQRRGCSVAIAPLPMEFLKEFSEPCPYNLKSIDKFLPAEVKEAVHIVSEGVEMPPANKSVRWNLARPLFSNHDDFLEFAWFDSNYPRLCVDVIETEYFYPKTEPGNGLVIYSGKYGKLDLQPVPGDMMITYDNPPTRKELGELLRSAEGMISYDPMSAINLESAICGTPVLMARGEMPPDSVFGKLGIITDAQDFYDANEQCKAASADYAEVRDEIAHDVDELLLACRLRWQ